MKTSVLRMYYIIMNSLAYEDIIRGRNRKVG